MTQTATQVIATFHAKPGREEALLEIPLGLIEPTRAEAGRRMYQLWRNRADLAELTVVEEWVRCEQPRVYTQTSKNCV